MDLDEPIPNVNATTELPPLPLLNWTTPQQRQQSLVAQIMSSQSNAKDLTPQENLERLLILQRTFKLFNNRDHSQPLYKQAQQLLSPETPEELQQIQTGAQLSRQRTATIRGPISTNVKFTTTDATKFYEDVAALDDGATNNFVSKSWLYDYMLNGGKFKTLSFDRVGHETFDGTVFYTYGQIELKLYIFEDREFTLIAHVTKDATSMYNVLLGMNFQVMNGVVTHPRDRKLFLAEDLHGLKCRSHRVEVNWNATPMAQTVLDSDLTLPVNAVLRINLPIKTRDPNNSKPKHRKSMIPFDYNSSYCTVPRTLNLLHTPVAVATSLVIPQDSSVGNYHEVPVQIFNSNDEPITIKKGTVLSDLYPVSNVPTDINVKLAQPPTIPSNRLRATEEEFRTLFAELKIDELDVSDADKARLTQLIRQYAPVFVKDSTQMGEVNLLKVSIDIQGHPPIRCKPYRVSATEREFIRIEVEKMLQAGVIEPSTSAFCSPVVLVPKPGGNIRFCVDFRKINAVTRKEVYPIPNVQDYLDVLQGNRYFSICDGAQAYYGCKLEEESKQYTAFICHLGTYQFTRAPFGLVNMPSIYQRLMNAVLAGMLWEECVVYLDDICVFSKTIDDHFVRLENLFKRLLAAGIVLKPSKCHLLQSTIRLLGHQADQHGTRPVQSKVDAIRNMRITNREDLHTFLGLTGYYSMYCPNYARITVPLRDLLKSKGPFRLLPEHSEAIQHLQSILSSEPCLRHPDWDYPFEIHCDASERALGVVLCQVIDGKEHVVGYYSRMIRDNEKHFPITQKECLAVVWACKKLRPYLYGRPFIIRTDHASLTWLLNLKEAQGRLMRYALVIQDYMYTIMHRKGKESANADALSRLVTTIASYASTLPSSKLDDSSSKIVSQVSSILAAPITRSQTGKLPLPRQPALSTSATPTLPVAQDPLRTPATAMPATPSSLPSSAPPDKPDLLRSAFDKMIRSIVSPDQEDNIHSTLVNVFRSEQRNDADCQSIIKLLRSNTEVKIKGVVYRLKAELLFRVPVLTINGTRQPVEQLVVPKTLVHEVIRLHHDHPTAGHFGSFRTLKKIQHYYYWQSMRKDVDTFCETCIPCRRNNRREISQGPLYPVKPQGPFDIVAIDCLQLPQSENLNAHVLVLIDYFTKYAHAYVLSGPPTTANVLRALVKFFSTHSFSIREFRLDQASYFTSGAFLEALDHFGVELSYVPTDHHRANGLVERLNRTLQNSLCKILDETVDIPYWEEYIDWAVLAYNTAYHEVIQDTPFFMMYGRHAVLPVDRWIFDVCNDNEFESIEDYKRNLVTRYIHTYSRARQHLNDYYRRVENEQASVPDVNFEIGDQVWVYIPEIQDKDVIRKLTYQWHGPFTILEATDSPVLYRVATNRPNKPDQIVHVRRLQKHRGQESRPTHDVHLNVPMLDFDWADLPRSTQYEEHLLQLCKTSDEQEPTRTFELPQHEFRQPLVSETALIGKRFLDSRRYWEVRLVRYHQKHKVMVVWYEELLYQNGKWKATKRTEYSSVPEVRYWIETTSHLIPT